MASAQKARAGVPSKYVITSVRQFVVKHSSELLRGGEALGRVQAGWRFATPRLKRAAALAAVSRSWEIFRRDAGAGDVGPSHETMANNSLLLTEDTRRDAMLLWFVDHGAPPIANAADTIATMVAATRRFGPDQLDLLAQGRDAFLRAGFAHGFAVVDDSSIEHAAAHPLGAAVTALERLRSDLDFIEMHGEEVSFALPHGRLNHYVPAEPGGCWAANLALLTCASPSFALPLPGLMSRALFRRDMERANIEAQLLRDTTVAANQFYMTLMRLEQQRARGEKALSHLSRHARAGEAWLLIAALGDCTRTQLRRALGLSRAGADIQAHALADAGLVTLAAGGLVKRAELSTTDKAPHLIDQGPLANAVSALDASTAEVDRLLARHVI